MNDLALETFSLNYFLATFLLPPIAFVLSAAIGVWLFWRHRAIGRNVALLSLAGLVIFSLPVVAFLLFKGLEAPPLDISQAKRAQAIVILAGGRSRSAVEWGGETVSSYTLARVRYGARLARETGLPVLLTGGLADHDREAEAELMRRVLEGEFGIRARWVETTSRNTAENAQLSARLLKPAGVSRVLLVTHSFHMPRSRAQFERAGLEVIPAPTGFQGLREFEWLHLVPQADALRLSHVAMREWLALARDRWLK